MAEHMIGVDIGTTSTKAVVYTLDGAVAAHHAVNYPLLRPTPAAAEQDPQQICAAVIEAIPPTPRNAPVARRGRCAWPSALRCTA